VFFLAQREPRFVGFSKRAACVVEPRKQSIFESAILDFVITTILVYFEIQKVEVSEN
jgi:hypothetical protein